MNSVLRLRGEFTSANATFAGGGHPALPAGQSLSSEHMAGIADSLQAAGALWDASGINVDPLICVHYDRVVAKSNRIKRLLATANGQASDRIVGARYDVAPDRKRRHVITYRVPRAEIDSTVALLRRCAAVIEERYDKKIIDNAALDALFEKGPEAFEGIGSRGIFAQVVKDAFYVLRFGVPDNMTDDSLETAFVTLYDTGRDAYELLKEVGIDDLIQNRVLGNSVLLTRSQYVALKNRAPYLVAMELDDANDWSGAEFDIPAGTFPSIGHPTNEPVVGVIDTPFDERAYFHEWVDYRDWLPDGLVPREADFAHGTSVSSIIVDGPSLNPDLDDGCGRFRVRHFGVALNGPFSSFDVMRKIREIVASNREIKVWNLSLGSVLEIQDNSISPEADILDRIQTEFDVVFVVAGTNRDHTRNQEKIGAPADSINSLVVNSVGPDNKVVDYARSGPVLSFFGKPDVSYYGGTSSHPIVTAGVFAPVKSSGTSLAAPWVARKMAFLIYKAGMTRELAKALIIDSAIGWRNEPADCKLGYGVVPKDIRSILQCRNDEIRFVVSGVAESYSTYSYDIPVPMREDKFPYVARATLCYFPHCDRNQGVDYTSTEMNLRFGRLKDKGVKPINGDTQGVEGARLNEDDARNYFRKWDNVKHVSEKLTPRVRPHKTYVDGSNLWGVKVITTDRSDRSMPKHQPFGLVVTLREINGVNRTAEFVQQCKVRRWMVDPIDIDQLISIYEAAEVNIEFED